MKVSLEQTGMVLMLITEDGDVPARVWQGETASGTPVVALITRVAPIMPLDDPRHAEFQRELIECRQPRTEIEEFLRHFQGGIVL